MNKNLLLNFNVPSLYPIHLPSIITAVTLSVTLYGTGYTNNSFASSQLNNIEIKQTLKANQIKIEQQAPVWIFPAGNNPLLQRDTKLLPAEQKLALALHPLLDQKKYTEALAAITAVSNENYKPAPILQLSPALLLVQGQVYLSVNEYELAKKSFLSAIKQLPDFIRAHKNLAVIYIKQQQYQQARKHLVKVITLGEGDAQLYGYLAYINLQLSSPWSAIAGYQQALLLEPNNQQWQQGLLYSLISAKNNHAAKAILNEMLQKTPNDIRLWLQRSRVSLDDNSPLDALTSLEMAIRLGNNDANNLITTAQLHLNHGSISRATDLMTQLLNQWQQEKRQQKNTKHLNAITSIIGWLVYEKHWAAAKKLLNQSKKHHKSMSALQQSQLTLHRARLPNNSHKQITQLYEKAIKLSPSNGHALIALAEHYQKINDYTQAQMLFIRAASLQNFAERSYIGHAQVHIEQKNYQQAVIMLRKALKLNPSRQDLIQNIRLLDQMNNNQI